MSEVLNKHSRMPRKQLTHVRAPSKRLGKPGLPIPADVKSKIIEAAKQEILEGLTIDQIAAKHGVSHYTLSLWLHALGDEYEQLRASWLDSMLIEAEKELRDASDPLGLARARELLRRAQWYAERRDRKRYGQDQQITVAFLDLGDRLRRARERVIDVSAQQIQQLSAPCQVGDENGQSARSAESQSIQVSTV